LLALVGSAAVSKDPRLAEWAAIEASVRRARVDAGSEHPSDPDGTAAFLILWSPAQHQTGAWLGAVIPRSRLSAMIGAAMHPLLLGQPFHAAIRHQKGPVIWSEMPTDATVAFTLGLRAVSGWELVFSRPASRGAFDPRRLLWYGLTLVVVMTLGVGVAITTYVVRREVELAQLQSEFIAAVTHEFKSPIASIRLLMERLASGRLRTPQAAAEYHDAINRETDRLERLVNRVLESQKIQAGEKRYSFVVASVIELAEASIWRLRPQADAKQITVDLELTGQIPNLPMDKAAITDALDNLVDNAIKYSPAGTRILIRMERRDRHVCVEVCDQGIGIDPDDLPRVFDKFYRGRRGDMHNVRGTGLGLALVKAAAEGHGGTVEVTSTPGQGARFCLRLPVEK
jgi:signal transduction histidine kinase